MLSHSRSFTARNNPIATGDYPTVALWNLVPVVVAPDNRFANVVANVLGTAARQGTVSYDASVAATVFACGNGHVGPPAPVDGTCACALPASLYRSARPTWFSTPWGEVAWPPVQPEADGAVDALPARRCFEQTVGQGLPFDPERCYR